MQWNTLGQGHDLSPTIAPGQIFSPSSPAAITLAPDVVQTSSVIFIPEPIPPQPQNLDTQVTHISSEVLETPLVIQAATVPGAPGGLDLSIDPKSDVGDILDTLSNWGLVTTTLDSTNKVSATLTERGKMTLWGGGAAILGLILMRRFGGKRPRRRTTRKRRKK